MNTVTDTTTATKDTAELLPLLQQLTKLAPDVCLCEQQQAGHYRFRLNSLGHVIDLVEEQDVAPIDYAALQWVLQEAIASKKLVVKLRLTRSQLWHSDLEFQEWSANDANPAIALLQAFLKALEAAA